MPENNDLSPEHDIPALRAMQDAAFRRIPADAERYANQEHATAIYVQGALFAVSIAQRSDDEALRIREELMRASQGDIILFPDELTQLRLRAAYHGAGLAAEPLHNIPRPIRDRLSDNLSNYPAPMEHEQQYIPWSYRFKPHALRDILRHDFSIAAQDSADGDLHRLGMEPEDDE